MTRRVDYAHCFILRILDPPSEALPDHRPPLTACDVTQTLWSVENISGGSSPPGALQSTYDGAFVNNRMEDDAMP
jgi:hypothetical protein